MIWVGYFLVSEMLKEHRIHWLPIILSPFFLALVWWFFDTLAMLTIDERGISRTLFGRQLERFDWQDVRVIQRIADVRLGEGVQIVSRKTNKGGQPLSMRLTNIREMGRLKGVLSRMAKERGIPLTSTAYLNLAPEKAARLTPDGLPVEFL